MVAVDQRTGDAVEGVQLVPSDRRALKVAEQLVEGEFAELLLLTRPDGGVEMWETDRREVVVFVYTTVAGLFASCGHGQPWRRTTVEELSSLADETADEAAAMVVFAVDVWHPEGARYPDPDVREMEPLQPAEYVQSIAEVWIAALPMAPGAKAAALQLFTVPPDGPKLLAYSSLDELRRCCGPYQAAVWVRPERLDEVARQAGAEGVLFGADLPDELRQQAPVVDWHERATFD